MSQSHHRFFVIRRFPTYSFWMVFFFIFLFLPACNPMYPPPPIPHIKAETVFYSYSINRGINALAWSPNGTRIAVAQDGPGATVQVWDAFTGKNRFSYQGHTFSAFTVAWSPGGRRIASGGENAQVWDATTGRLLLEQ